MAAHDISDPVETAHGPALSVRKLAAFETELMGWSRSHPLES